MTTPTRVLVTGLLATFRDGFHAQLTELGYSPSGTEAKLRLLAHLSRWLAGEGLEPAELTAQTAEQFLQVRRDAGYATNLSLQGLAPLMNYLRAIGEIPAVEKPRHLLGLETPR